MGDRKKKSFIKLPRYLGDRDSFRDFVAKNMVYPPEALKHRIEGVVHLSYRVDDKGNIHELTVDHGIGYGCDEEAIRLVKLMRYTPVKNRGMKVKSKQRTRIEFRLPKTGPEYSVTTTTKDKETEEKKTGKITYSYTLKISQKKN